MMMPFVQLLLLLTLFWIFSKVESLPFTMEYQRGVKRELTTCVDDPSGFLSSGAVPDSVNNCTKVFNVLSGNCAADMSPYLLSGGFTPPTSPYLLSDLCCETCTTMPTPTDNTTNNTNCDIQYCGSYCYQYAYCATDPDELCANAPADCFTRCTECDPCEDDAGGFLALIGGCEGVIAFVGGVENFCNADLSEFDYTGQTQPMTFFGWMVCPSYCESCPDGNFTSSHCEDDPSGILDIFGNCQTVASLVGSASLFCAIDVSEFDDIGAIPPGTLGTMLCPKMCHGCNPTEASNIYTETYGYSNITACAAVNCTFLNVSGSFNDGADAAVLASIRSLRKVILAHNGIYSMGFKVRNMLDLLDIDASSNRLTAFETESFFGLAKLKTLDLSYNAIREMKTAALASLVSLERLYLMFNSIDYVDSYAFTTGGDDGIVGEGTLMVLNIAHQYFRREMSGGDDVDGAEGERYLRLNESAFAGCCVASNANIVVTRNRIPTIPANAFAGLRSTTLHLDQIGLERAEDSAFANIENVRIDLRGNNIQYMSARAFHNATVPEADGCIDYPGFEIVFSVVPGYENKYTCDAAAGASSELEHYLWTLRSPGQVSVFEACCLYGGGNPFGLYLMVDAFSDVTCRISNSTGGVQCGCGCKECRFDVMMSTCKSSCDLGQRWEDSLDALDTDDLFEASTLISVNVSGSCIDCQPGRYGTSETWSPVCGQCEPGYFSDESGATDCNKCESGRFSNPGATSCADCPYGKFAPAGSRSCDTCSPLFIGSEKCNVPVLGFAIVMLAGFVIAVFGVILRKHLKRQNMLKNMLITEVAKHRKLVKTKGTDLALMSLGWTFSPSQITLDQKLASNSASGAEVWKGSLNGTWCVAVKVISGEHKELIEKELQFMMRTRHERLTMFLGCGEFEDKSLFLLSEYMEGGSLDRILWDKSIHLPWVERLQILLDTSEALAFLHLLRKSIHRDVKSSNVLLTHPRDGSARRAKLADFGSSRLVKSGKKFRKGALNRSAESGTISKHDSGSSTGSLTTVSSHTPLVESPRGSNQGGGFGAMGHKDSSTLRSKRACGYVRKMNGFVGTAAWMAPEMMAVKAIYGPQVDIYSFGILMWESLCRREPWVELRGNVREIFDSVRDGRRPPIASAEMDTPKEFVELMRECWSPTVEDRPMIGEVRGVLEDMLRECATIRSRSHRSVVRNFAGTDDRPSIASSKSFTWGSSKSEETGKQNANARRFSAYLDVRRASGLFSAWTKKGDVETRKEGASETRTTEDSRTSSCDGGVEMGSVSIGVESTGPSNRMSL